MCCERVRGCGSARAGPRMSARDVFGDDDEDAPKKTLTLKLPAMGLGTAEATAEATAGDTPAWVGGPPVGGALHPPLGRAGTSSGPCAGTAHRFVLSRRHKEARPLKGQARPRPRRRVRFGTMPRTSSRSPRLLCPRADPRALRCDTWVHERAFALMSLSLLRYTRLSL